MALNWEFPEGTRSPSRMLHESKRKSLHDNFCVYRSPEGAYVDTIPLFCVVMHAFNYLCISMLWTAQVQGSLSKDYCTKCIASKINVLYGFYLYSSHHVQPKG